MKNCIVVGGGVSGLFAAIMAKDHFDSVTVVESQPQCGGLLRSWTNAQGVIFDYGTHILSETDSEAVNRILFKGMYDHPEQWTSLNISKVSNSFNGQLYLSGQFIPLPFLAQPDYHRALTEILSAPGISLEDADNFEQYSKNNYGDTITYQIFQPMMQKLQNAQLADLHPSVHGFFGLSRFIPGDGDLCRELKKSAIFDAKLAFASYQEGVSAATKFYPKNGGIELWVEQLLQQATDKGVVFKTASQISGLEQNQGKVHSVTLKTSETLLCDHLIWTIPPIFAIKLLGLDYHGESPKFCPMSLHHMVFDQAFLDSNYYSSINDLNAQGFRLTLYPNVTLGEVTGPHRCTVEVLCSDIDDKDTLNNTLVAELKSLGYVAADANLLSVDVVDVPMGFPQFTNAFVAEKSRQIDRLNETLQNITLVGKASRCEFFIYGILKETHQMLSELFAGQGGEI